MHGSPNISNRIDNAIDKLDFFIDQQLSRCNSKNNKENSINEKNIKEIKITENENNILAERKENNQKKIMVPLLKLDSLNTNLSSPKETLKTKQKEKGSGKSEKRKIQFTIHRNKKKELRFLTDEEMVRKWLKEENPLKKDIPKDLKSFLKDGSFLCHLLNKYLDEKNSINTVFEQPCKKFLFRNNIESFLKGCKDLGVEEEHLFEVNDLFESKNMDKVYFCILSLGDALINRIPKQKSEVTISSDQNDTTSKAFTTSPRFLESSNSNFCLNLTPQNTDSIPQKERTVSLLPKPSHERTPTSPRSRELIELTLPSSPRSNNQVTPLKSPRSVQLPISPRSTTKNTAPSSPRSNNQVTSMNSPRSTTKNTSSNQPSSPRSTTTPMKTTFNLNLSSITKNTVPTSPRSSTKPISPRNNKKEPRFINLRELTSSSYPNFSPRSNKPRSGTDSLSSPEKDKLLLDYVENYLKENGFTEEIDLKKIVGDKNFNYMIGTLQMKLRILKSQVYVRVAGGFEVLQVFLNKKLNNKVSSPKKSPRTPLSKKLRIFNEKNN